MEIESLPRVRSRVVYRLAFQRRWEPTEVVRFRCDREGRVGDAGLTLATEILLRSCRTGPDFFPPWIEEVQRSEFVPGRGRCQCGVRVRLDRTINRCLCGRQYGIDGRPIEQLVLDRRLLAESQAIPRIN